MAAKPTAISAHVSGSGTAAMRTTSPLLLLLPKSET
jgi:hypothetical protein